MKILHVTPSYIPAWRYGGTIASVHGLCRSLVRLGHEVHVFTTNVDGASDSDVLINTPVDIDGVKVWYFPSKPLRRLYWAPLMKKALQEKGAKFNVWHLHSLFLWPTWMSAREAEKQGIPYLIAPRGMLVKELVRRKNRWIKSFWIRIIEKRTLERAAGVHVTSDLESKEMLEFDCRPKRIFVVPNGVEAMGEKTSGKPSALVEKIVHDGPFILFLGRIHWKKGLNGLVAALSFVPEARLVIAGNDEENYRSALENIARTHGVIHRIQFTGAVCGADKSALLVNATALALPSVSENFGNVVLEAMAAGCPVVVSREVGLSDAVRDTGSGLVCARDSQSIAEALRKLMNDKALCVRMGESGKRAVRERFNWDSIAVKMTEAYQAVKS